MTLPFKGWTVSPAVMRMEVNKVPEITAEYLCPVVSSVCWKQDDSKVKFCLLTKLLKFAEGPLEM